MTSANGARQCAVPYLSSVPSGLSSGTSVHTSLPRGHFSPLIWQERLQATLTEDEAVEVARNFMTTFTTSELESLPAVCQPGSILTAPDVTDYASRLVQHRCEDSEGIAYAIHRLATFFSSAAARIGELRQDAKSSSSHQTSA